MTAADLHAEVTLRDVNRDLVRVWPVTDDTPSEAIRSAARAVAPHLSAVLSTSFTVYPGSRSAVVTLWKD